jgi:DNA-binding response OmpR family regulator
MRILIVEDDALISELLRRGLADQHYVIDIASDGDEGLDLALSNDYDLIILDIILPKMNGRDLCREVRREGVMVPILMLTGLGSSQDVITSLDLGADDYLTKPFDLGVLQARVRSLTRRRSDHRTASIVVGDLCINTADRTVTRSGRELGLTPKEYALLEYLALNRGRVLSREAIGEHVWDMHFDPRSNVIDSLVRTLRQKIDRGFPVPLIDTVRGFGYRLSDEGPS